MMNMENSNYRHDYKLCRECDVMVWLPVWRTKPHEHMVLNVEKRLAAPGKQQVLV